MLYSILIGGIAGWLAGKLMKGGGYGIFKNIILGIIGGILGGWLFGVAGIHILNGWLGDLFEGVIGAIIIMAVVAAIKKK
ncbi:GlsB/YeaQ/YmgE family stress response membrane protein [uncultured Lutibacter sp.]|uniref:GlsB/YeaQ/YmgE family stress response membrane protein n=1 Tax=uncultured Lutibacter sp. TaxID=437739 RepID=UPI0026334080|nr:GlsB/YeaQ/YmgE family stress response membrane protein [uncultured Lutibacter sp.]